MKDRTIEPAAKSMAITTLTAMSMVKTSNNVEYDAASIAKDREKYVRAMVSGFEKYARTIISHNIRIEKPFLYFCDRLSKAHRKSYRYLDFDDRSDNNKEKDKGNRKNIRGFPTDSEPSFSALAGFVPWEILELTDVNRNFRFPKRRFASCFFLVSGPMPLDPADPDRFHVRPNDPLGRPFDGPK